MEQKVSVRLPFCFQKKIKCKVTLLGECVQQHSLELFNPVIIVSVMLQHKCYIAGHLIVMLHIVTLYPFVIGDFFILIYIDAFLRVSFFKLIVIFHWIYINLLQYEQKTYICILKWYFFNACQMRCFEYL